MTCKMAAGLIMNTSKTFTNSGYTIDNSAHAKDDYNELKADFELDWHQK